MKEIIFMLKKYFVSGPCNSLSCFMMISDVIGLGYCVLRNLTREDTVQNGATQQ